MPELAVWTIFFLPLGSFVLITLSRPFFGSRWSGAGTITVLAMAGAFILSLIALIDVIVEDSHNIGFESHDWLTVGSLTLRVGLVMDTLTAVMVTVVTGVSLVIQLYSTEYMRKDPSSTRFFAYMSLFTASMLGLVMASNFAFLFVFWELVGLSSFLLIGFWFKRPAAMNAAKKAFIVTRLGDVGLLAAIAWAYAHTGTLEFEELRHMAEIGTLTGAALTWLTLGIFAGAVGKSGQFPLHVWLPDAMEGPTPVSALIHAATMVAAGVFLVARVFPLFEHSADALTVVAWIGGGTAMFAASMALVSNDIKRVLAFSTVSQLGYMFLALGTGSIAAAMFHLLTHAFFKALLFLGAGSVHHTTETYDMRFMGGLGKAMPWTFATMTIAGLALVGVFPFSGFWSKDAILGSVFENSTIAGAGTLFWIGVVTTGLTGFYVFRMLFMTFTGQYRGGAQAEAAAAAQAGAQQQDVTGTETAPAHGGGLVRHLHESPWIMLLPLVALTIPAVAAGLVDLPWGFLGIPAHPLTSGLGGEVERFSSKVALLSSVAGGIGIVLAISIYLQHVISAEALGRRFAPVYTLLSNRYYIDYFYEEILVRRVMYSITGGILEFVDTHIVDRTVNVTGWVGRSFGRIPGSLQNGQTQLYGAVMAMGVIFILAAFWIWG